MSEATAIRHTCATCVYYLAATMECMHWGHQLDSAVGCPSWMGEDGVAGDVRETRTLLRVQITEGDDAMADKAELMDRITRMQEQVESLQVQISNLASRMDEHREYMTRLDGQLDALAAEITRLQQQGGGDAERTLRIVEQALGLAERRVSA